MKNKAIFLLPIFIIVLLSSFAFGIDAKANLYRDDVYLFRIKFPVGWEIKDGDGKNVIKKAVDRKSFSSITISAIKLLGNIDMKDFSQRERDDFLKDSVVSLKEKFSNVRVIEKGIRHLDNKMAIYLKYSYSYRTLDKTVDLMMIQYTTIYKGRFYSVGGGAPKNLFASQEGVINKSIASFVVEEADYGLKDFSNTNLIAYRDDKFVFEYPKTWSEVPSTHKATKIKIVNENGIGDSDCGINIQYDPSLRENTPKEVIAKISNPQAMQGAMRTAIPDASITKSGLTYLSNQEAFYTITKFTYRGFDLEVPMKMLQIQTARIGYIYTFSCRTSSERFDDMFPTFQLIAAGFTLKP